MTPPEYLAVDEAVIPFKGRSRGKQYLKKKPKKWGFKVWVLAASNGYVSKFELYQGKRDEAGTDLGIISDTVLRMCSGIGGLNHKLFLDNLFVSYKLLKRLVENDIHVVGVVRSDRLYGANSVLPGAKDFSKEERGQMNVATSEDNITILQWKDTGVVYVSSTYAGIEPKDKAERWDKVAKKYIMVDRPHCVAIYNQFMGGVDLSDRMVAHYPHAMKSKRFYLRIFFYFLNVAIVNAWIVLKLKTSSNMSFLDFKAAIANALIKTTLKKKRVGRPPTNTPPLKKRCRPGVIGDVRFDGEGHYPSKSVPGRCREKNCKSRTRYKCSKCEVPVCPECMANFHDRSL
ncbi:piggyBac transposable element-derived protein 3-like [Macrosteles quadrilineatus]|uniref:piggyBac transposable element-derived protein 3-like n=1 Tax=Macrosteles quadrilineatus TaxID=74068 RepID=UPI0023E0FADE|nr:piggyBac transposable element-derived protein 3-like [Macrosteles quadrilineatus]